MHYRGDIVTHGGSTYQARCDTAREPPHGDWICVAYAGVDGKDGRDGRSPEVRGLFSDKEIYKALDVVVPARVTECGALAFHERGDRRREDVGGWQVGALDAGTEHAAGVS